MMVDFDGFAVKGKQRNLAKMDRQCGRYNRNTAASAKEYYFNTSNDCRGELRSPQNAAAVRHREARRAVAAARGRRTRTEGRVRAGSRGAADHRRGAHDHQLGRAPPPALPPNLERVILPGFCRGEVDEVSQAVGAPTVRGPNDLRDLPEFFGKQSGPPPGYGTFDIEILAEINHAPKKTARRDPRRSPPLPRQRCGRDRPRLRPRRRRGPASATRCARCEPTASASPSTASTRTKWKPRSRPGRNWC